MERKTTQRIIGILVVVALVVILLPLLFNGNSSSASQTTEVKAPPFPDQAAPTQASATSASPVSQTPTDTINNPSPSTALAANENTVDTPATTTPATPAPSDNSAAMPGMNAAPSVPAPAPATPAIPPAAPTPPTAAAPSTTTPNTLSTPDATTTTTTTTVAPTKTSDTTAVQSSDSFNIPPMANNETSLSQPVIQKVDGKQTADTASDEPVKPANSHREKVKMYKPKHLVQKNQELKNLKNAAWVVQMGSFKNKTNAIRLTNRLRAQGYKAFTREIKSTMRVYVGPEIRQASATSLATKLEQQLNMHGIVVSYHPLEL